MSEHHHHRRSNHQMDDAELIKQKAPTNAIKSIVPADVFLMHCYHCLPCVGYS